MERSNTIPWYVSDFDFKLYCKAKKEMDELIELIHIEDKQFAALAQFASVGEATLPSGFKVPKGDWKVVRTYLIKNFSQPE